MLNFVICDDNSELVKINKQIINKIMFNNNIEYKIFSFETYNNDFKTIIDSQIGKKVYLLDIELEGKSGIEIAREIRKKDWDSIILISTAHTELFPEVFKNKLLLFDFVSKFDNYTKNLENSLEKVVKIYSTKIPFNFNIRKIKHQVSYEEIIYFYFNKDSRKTTLRTTSKSYEISKSLKSLTSNLPDYYIKINNHCIINKNNIKEIGTDGTIVFINNEVLNETINKEIKKHVFS